jgi:misacylated tRNA(Ala) deacylase
MNMELLFLLNPYVKEFDATVTDVITDDTGNYIVLDRTAFYATSGGQPNDLGIITINGEVFNVVDVLKKDGLYLHRIDRSGLKVGDSVHGIINWDRRYKLMRYHTASHILSTIIFNETGADITGNQIYLDKARVDFSLEAFDRNLMQSFEEKTNAIIKQALPVTFRILDREEAFKIPSLVKLRKQLPETITQIRIVDIEGFDHQACGGTHLNNTSECGSIEIYDLENKGKERRRIYFRIRDA